ncbi:hypothetical protein ACFFMR_04310 [Micromonospora andamanensis]|uniref:Uncharacterized protein n=1 Tax=Micromonospora andamanensis TaxID=1287068 RepID=A0ABQ4HZS1_9ACTN|nr:hypothetical protein [Micromonospora andamanensis]GIJ11129.1 hypothetical protein Van01_43430 [Micromonospora andamanensis]
MRQEEQQLNNDHPETVRSAPVAVPDTDDDRETHEDLDTVDEPTDRDRSEADRGRPWDGRPGSDGERAEFNEPGPVPTAFGATTVGGAVAASALASPRPEDERDPREEDTARPGDGAVDGEREGWRADPTAEFDRTDDGVDRTGDGVDRADDDPDDNDVEAPVAADRTADDRLTDDPVDEDRLTDDPVDVDRATDDDSRVTVADDDTAAAGGAGYGSATPTMVDPDTQTSGTGTDTSGAAVPAGAATLFDEATAQGFRDRWRDVQLRFVDDPRAAAGEAQSLVEEAMEALAAALAEHRNKLGGWQEAGSSDTEQLRVAVREYRDFLDRVLGR